MSPSLPLWHESPRIGRYQGLAATRPPCLGRHTSTVGNVKIAPSEKIVLLLRPRAVWLLHNLSLDGEWCGIYRTRRYSYVMARMLHHHLSSLQASMENATLCARKPLPVSDWFNPLFEDHLSLWLNCKFSLKFNLFN